MTSYSYFGGIDWASQSHSLCVIDAAGRIELRLDIAHSKEGIERLIRQFKSFADSGGIAVAIERPSGVLVDALVEAGLQVVPIHPNALKASRPRYRSAGKSDPGDAFMLADVLRADGHRFRPLDPRSDELRALRALVRTRDDLVTERVALANQLRSLLESFWPGATEIFADIDSPIALAFVARYPTPQSAAHPGEKRLASFLAQHSYCGRRPVTALLERLRAAASGCAGELEAEAKGELVRSLACILERLVAEAGVAPVTYQSGKHRAVTFRWACNHRLRRALTCFADLSRHGNAWATAVYLARAWVRIIWRAWTNRTLYDPNLHRGAATLQSVKG